MTQDLPRRTFLVTGASTGIGQATALALAARGGRVYVAARPAGKGRETAASIAAQTGNPAVEFIPLDLTNLASVRGCAQLLIDRGEPLHVLINNAGVAGRRGLTKDGFELTFGVNHLGHFALTTALLGVLKASAPARVVNVSSDSHYQAKGVDFDVLRRPARSITGLPEYAVSKLCNVLFTQELARRLGGGVTASALHPGVVASDMWRRVPWPIRPLITRRMLTTEQGARTPVYCATSPELDGVSGRFYQDCRERQPSAVATAELGRLLWEHSESWIKP
jgi:retinol dehydrogenase-12